MVRSALTALRPPRRILASTLSDKVTTCVRSRVKASSDVASRRMRAVRREDTDAEMRLRRALHRLGARYRLHDRRLPGSPDLTFGGARAAVFVHGCFWHRHANCPRSSMPKSNVQFWTSKFSANVARDATKASSLESLGWRVFVLWECEIERDAEASAKKVIGYLKRSNGQARR